MNLPATPEALFDSDAPAPEPVGLTRAFYMGEKIAWKGIWFRIAAVGVDRILLEPIEETASNRKRRLGND